MSENMRKDILVNDQIYHIFTKSIAGFKIFNNNYEFLRMMETIQYYQKEKPLEKFSRHRVGEYLVHLRGGSGSLVEIIAFCLMPTHLHLILKQLKEKGISIFMNNVLNSYTRYFNTRHKRKGPLWEGRFKNVLVKTDEQLLHLTRYLHLNPVTAYLVDKPENWLFSSYQEYVSETNKDKKICKFDDILEIRSAFYKKFVEDGISYQRDLAEIKELLLE